MLCLQTVWLNPFYLIFFAWGNANRCAKECADVYFGGCWRGKMYNSWACTVKEESHNYTYGKKTFFKSRCQWMGVKYELGNISGNAMNSCLLTVCYLMDRKMCLFIAKLQSVLDWNHSPYFFTVTEFPSSIASEKKTASKLHIY